MVGFGQAVLGATIRSRTHPPGPRLQRGLGSFKSIFSLLLVLQPHTAPWITTRSAAGCRVAHAIIMYFSYPQCLSFDGCLSILLVLSLEWY